MPEGEPDFCGAPTSRFLGVEKGPEFLVPGSTCAQSEVLNSCPEQFVGAGGDCVLLGGITGFTADLRIVGVFLGVLVVGRNPGLTSLTSWQSTGFLFYVAINAYHYSLTSLQSFLSV